MRSKGRARPSRTPTRPSLEKSRRRYLSWDGLLLESPSVRESVHEGYVSARCFPVAALPQPHGLPRRSCLEGQIATADCCHPCSPSVLRLRLSSRVGA